MTLKITPITNNAAFKSEQTANPEVRLNDSMLVRQPDVDTLENSNKKGKGKRIILGTVIALGAVILADFIFAKGRHIKNIFGSKGNGAISGTKDEAKEVIQSLNESGVKFKKGEAFDRNNKLFSGKFYTENKKGEQFVFEYNKGELKEVEKKLNNISLSTKKYFYNDNGKFDTIIHEPFTMDGTFKNIIRYDYYENGKLKSVTQSEKIINKPFETKFGYNHKNDLVSITTKTPKMVNNKMTNVVKTRRTDTFFKRIGSFFYNIFRKKN